jgi:lipopolysaccharide/colanic/teichoic acid biosynthesis glycosyltransferase
MTKRLFDVLFSLFALIFFGWIIILSFFITTLDTLSWGFFLQKRVGHNGKLFTIIKLKTIHPKTRQISIIGKFLRKYKIDELPQFINILIGDMSLVGYRPDVPGYYDKLEGENRKVLELKPGLFSEATLKYVNEETIHPLRKVS